jgi:hypothetical protein
VADSVSRGKDTDFLIQELTGNYAHPAMFIGDSYAFVSCDPFELHLCRSDMLAGQQNLGNGVCFYLVRALLTLGLACSSMMELRLDC